MSAQPDLDRLAGAVKARRIQLHPSRVAAAAAAGVVKDTWRRVEEGRPVREVTYAKMEPALNWATGSCAAVLAGDGPTEIDPVPGAPDAVMSRLDPSVVSEVVQLAAIATTRGLTADEIRTLSDRVVQDLRERGLI